MHHIGNKETWPPKKYNTPWWKDKSKWFAYHENFGYLTKDCFALKKEIRYLLRKGHLNELLGRKKDKTSQGSQHLEILPQKISSPPLNTKVINFIYGGSDIYGTSYSATKRHSRSSKMEKGRHAKNECILYRQEGDLFRQTWQGEWPWSTPWWSSHNTLCGEPFYSKKILIDGGSLMSIILLETLNKMNIPDSEIVRTSSILVGFSTETKKTITKIKPPIYIEGVSAIQHFLCCWFFILI